jgi:hypothetical protein
MDIAFRWNGSLFFQVKLGVCETWCHQSSRCCKEGGHGSIHKVHDVWMRRARDTSAMNSLLRRIYLFTWTFRRLSEWLPASRDASTFLGPPNSVGSADHKPCSSMLQSAVDVMMATTTFYDKKSLHSGFKSWWGLGSRSHQAVSSLSCLSATLWPLC